MFAGINTTVLIAAVAGGFMLLLVIILATLCSIRRMQKRNEPQTSSLGRPESQRDTSEMTAVSRWCFFNSSSTIAIVPLSLDAN